MHYKFIQCEQRSIDWYQARLGRLTGSRALDMVAVRKDGQPMKKRDDLVLDLIAQRLTGIDTDENQYVSLAMQRGIDMEAQALGMYEARTGSVVHRSGFLQAIDFPVGCSLDGHIQGKDGGIEGIIEIKCLNTTTHLEVLRGGILPVEFIPQITHNLWVSGAQWCDFISFDDRFHAPELQLFVRRYVRNDQAMRVYEGVALTFLAEVKTELERIHDMYVKRAA